MYVVVVSQNKNGKIELTKEQLEQMLTDAYNKGKWEQMTQVHYPINYGWSASNAVETDRVTINC